MNRWRLPGAIAVAVTLLSPMLAAPPTTLGKDLSLNPLSTDPSISALWDRADGAVARQKSDHAWLLGPAVRAIAREPYAESPGGSRQVFYFDKARLEIPDPKADRQSPWYVSSGALVRELISGRIQFGDAAFIQSSPAPIRVTGDLQGNPLSPTYQTLAPLASVGDDAAARRAPARVGQPVVALLHADGSLDEQGVPDSTVLIGRYDDHLGHNVPAIFDQWAGEQPFAVEWLLGYPLTEPYWVDSVVGGSPRRVLVQAFERRVLTYTPDNPDGWKVESGNVGLHYRLWRGLSVPDDQNLAPLAGGIPLGETIVGAALAHGIDPYLLAGVAKVASNFNPLAEQANGGRGLLGYRADRTIQDQWQRSLDPAVNAELAADLLARLHSFNEDWRAVLAIYYTGSEHPDWSDPALGAFVDGVLTTQGQLIAAYNHPPAQLAETPALRLVGRGAAAFYSPGYSVAWWNRTIAKHAAWGNAVPDWSIDPNGYYCVNPDFRPGQRLQLTANGVTLWCTIGDSVAAGDIRNWRAHWVIELSYNTYVALGLNRHNVVEVRAP